MKRVLCILSSLDAGGAETFLMKVYHALPPEEYQLDFIVSVEGGCYTDEVQERGGRIYTIPMRTQDLWHAFWGIRRIVCDNNYECVLKLGNTSDSVVDLIAAKLGGARCIAMRSCNALTGLSLQKRMIHWALRPVLNLVTDVKLAPSMLAAEFTFGKWCARRNVHLLHNGVDLSIFRFDPAGRERIRKEFYLGDCLVVGHVGRFHKQKNHPFLLEVFREIKSRREDAILLLVGTGGREMEEDIRGRVREMGLESSVVFTGIRFDVPQLLSAMDVFVFPSLHEGMPNTVIEAQATGLPCVIAETITKEADITGLVEYLPLESSPGFWADTALAVVEEERRETGSVFMVQGYDIDSVAGKLMGIFWPEDGEYSERGVILDGAQR